MPGAPRTPGALEDVDWILEHKPDDIDLERMEEFRQQLLRQGQ